MKKLKPCPFCGMKARHDDDFVYTTYTCWKETTFGRKYLTLGNNEIPDGICWRVVCPEELGGCDASISADTLEAAVEKWNRRTPTMKIETQKKFNQRNTRKMTPTLAHIKKIQMEARKNKDKLTTAVLTTFIGDIQMLHGRGIEVTEELVIDKLQKYIKNARTNYKISEDDEYQKEIGIFESFLPPQLTVDELLAVCSGGNFANVGEFMRELKRNHPGGFDGQVAAEVAKQYFS